MTELNDYDMTDEQLKNLRAQVDAELEKRDTPEGLKAAREHWQNTMNGLSDAEFHQRTLKNNWKFNHDGK